MVYDTPLIVLASTKVGDKSLVLHTLSPGWGRRSFITGTGKGAAMAMFLPLSLLDCEVVENPKSDLWRARSLSVSEPLAGIRGNVRKNTMCLFMSEVLYRTIKDGALEDGLFEWCRGSILTLDALQADFSNYHLRFLLEFAGALGFSPTLEDLAPFAGEHYAVVRDLVQADAAESLLIPMTGAQRNAVASLLLDYIGFHTESQLNVRSLHVLREIFS
ncbi:MAG: DNA repair protein RecO C-terminal domain-containing protein [Bacteroidales bacterium]|nr:DNA repair protein RecO C-terminal domain-containing protein [Bacteroidales bacterium]